MRARAAAIWGSTLGRHLVLTLAALVVLVVVLESVSDYRNTQLAAMAYLGIAAGGLTVLTGTNGQLSLGHGALMAVGAYTAALLLPERDSGMPLSVVVVAAVLTTLAVGTVVGLAAARLHGPYLAGATLALAVAVPGIALYFKQTLGGEQGLRVVMPEIPVWVLDVAFFVTGQELTRSRFTAYVGWLTLIVVYLLLANLGAGRTGRRWRAVRDAEVAAELAGIDLGRARVSAFMVSAAAAGAAGAIVAFTVKLAAPSAFTLTLSLTLLAAIVLGGLGSLTGALLGAGLLTFLPGIVTDLGRGAGLDDIRAAELAPLVYGLVTVAVILLAPAGIVGSLRGALARRRSTHRTTSSKGTSA
ncbi:branched-chain amino acid ABC transporter permease [Nocardioides sp. zg-1228]|uniref:branched-chain amino acid ABC transporter permease n=1 Tax=Nocardioides sp. zg-1228 TaxID=2763008 RepID=UPI001642E76E|nr:branched-chain amino acid ABC transporter permease [Nocardioides sp. zg-1228]MBC2934822.1 branched-chain amino acid ABC transporter permease [Nocardioides sp. zg-1228]QSF58387.1 branched-chain amino acid ABC transporter permease [Nocardioides sp. zg-1228]